MLQQRRFHLVCLLCIALGLLLIGRLPSGPASTVQAQATLSISNLKTEYMLNPIGIDVTRPRFGWQLSSSARSQMQRAYQLLVASSQANLDANIGDKWDSGQVSSDQSSQVEYNGSALAARARYYWKVRVWDGNNMASAWSASAFFELGLLSSSDWTARWISEPGPTLTWGDYALDVDVTIVNDRAGIVFRARDVSNLYMWQIARSNGAKLVPHVRVNGAWSVLKTVDIAAAIPPAREAGENHVRIELAGSTIRTIVNGMLVDTTTHSTFSAGSVGFRTAGSEHGLFDNLVVTSGGSTLFSDAFNDPNTLSFGMPTSGGKLRVQNATESVMTKSPLLRKGFAVSKTVRRARVYATALGVYELYLNGQRVGQDYLNPGWTTYTKRLAYQTYDVTSLIVSGNNALGAMLGNGWYAGEGWIRSPVPGTSRSLRAQLEIEFTDGTTQRVASDASWKALVDGPIQMDSIYNGESYDARKEQPGWATGSFNDAAWPVARDVSSYTGQVVAQNTPTIRVMQNLAPVAITNPAPGTYIFDMGQNMVGWVQLRVQGSAGTTVKLRFGEMLENGGLYTANLRSARQTDLFALRGTGAVELFEPRFTYHGFRYVEVTGFPGTPTLSAITGRVVYANLPQTGNFTTSNALINKLHQNIVWGQRGNFLAVPTDCPQRDERLGWMGDGQIFAATAAFNMDVSAYFSKWTQDIEDEQFANGAYPVVVPIGELGAGSAPSSGWAEAGVIIPWTIYQSYGDTRIINQRWSSMVRFISYMQSRAVNNLQPASSSVYGDWLDVEDTVPKEVLATIYYGHSVNLMAKMARATGRSAEAASYESLFHSIRSAFTSAYVAADGMIPGNTQSGYTMAIAMDMLPGDRVPGAARYLVENIRSRGTHLSTGFLGTKDLNIALTRAGYLDVAYQLLNQRTYPSWLFPIDNGATTMWERWNSWTPTGGFGNVGMNSFNHYSFGAVGEWMYTTIAGISSDPHRPGYKGIVIRPQPGGGLTSARGEYQSSYGPILSDWQLLNNGATFRLNVNIPANTTATIFVPAIDSNSVSEGGILASTANGVTYLGMENGAAVYAVGSGSYSFSSSLVPNAGFETPAQAAGGYTYAPANSGWTFTGDAGVASNGSPWLTPHAPEGTQVAFLQRTGSIAQTLGSAPAGTTYQVSFSAAQRPAPWGGQTFEVYLGTTLLGSFTPAGTSFQSFTTAPVAAGGGSLLLRFVGLNPGGGDKSAVIDSVRIVATSSAGSWVVCASENQTCSFSGTKRVRYGANASFSYGTFSGSVACSNAIFGDPLPNVAKQCFYNNPPATGPTATPTRTNTSTGPTATPTRTNTSTGPSPTRTNTSALPGGSNIALNKPASGSAACNTTTETAAKAVDGLTSTKWCSGAAGTKQLQVDLGASATINGFVVKHAGAGGESTVWNTRDFRIETSADNVSWSNAVTIAANTASQTTHTITPRSARYVRLSITAPTSNGDLAARIYELEVYGSLTGPTATRTRTNTASPPTATRTNTSASGNPAWAPGVAYVPGNRVSYGGLNYQCLQAHTSQAGWEPPNTPALWQQV